MHKILEIRRKRNAVKTHRLAGVGIRSPSAKLIQSITLARSYFLKFHKVNLSLEIHWFCRVSHKQYLRTDSRARMICFCSLLVCVLPKAVKSTNQNKNPTLLVSAL